MSLASKLDKASGLLFLAGLVFSKIRNFPIPMFSVVMNTISLVFYVLGYSIWVVSSWLYPSHTKTIDAWYGFAQFKEQYLYAAIIGFVGTVLSLTSFVLPILVIPAAWLFLASNLMWTFAEYHKLKNPPDDPNYSHSFQEQYLSYAMLMTGVTVIGAIYTTLIIIFPPLIIPLYALTTIIGIGVNILAVEVWLNFTFNNHQPSNTNQSHQSMQPLLNPEATCDEQPTDSPPHPNIILFQKPTSPQPLASQEPEQEPPLTLQTQTPC